MRQNSRHSREKLDKHKSRHRMGQIGRKKGKQADTETIRHVGSKQEGRQAGRCTQGGKQAGLETQGGGVGSHPSGRHDVEVNGQKFQVNDPRDDSSVTLCSSKARALK